MGVHVAQWAKRPPLKLEVPGLNPRRWFSGRAGNLDPGNGAGAVTHPIDRAGTVFPRGTGGSLLKRVSVSHPFAVSAMKHSVTASIRLCGGRKKTGLLIRRDVWKRRGGCNPSD